MSALYFYLLLLIVHPIASQWWKIFPKVGAQSWAAFIPFYNYWVVSKIGRQPAWYGLLMIFPGIHLVMYFVFNIALVRRFGFFDLKSTAQAVFLPWIMTAKIASDSTIESRPETNWLNAKEVADRTPGDHLVLFLSLPVFGHILAYSLGSVFKPAKGKSAVRDWAETVIFALVAASAIRPYVFEPFKIPTGSMEKTLLIGDFLFVNKLPYGTRVPNTPLSFPLFHNNIPYFDIPSYLTWETIGYTRLPGWAKVERYDVVVFNYPSGDTSIYDARMPQGLMGHDYHGIVINESQRLYLESKGAAQPLQQYFYQNYNKTLQQYFYKNYNKALQTIYDKPTLEAFSKDSSLTLDKLWPKYEADFWQEYFNNLNVWKNKAREEIAVRKRTFSTGERMFIDHKGIIYRPVDKRENYIKRCVGIPGDSIEIIDAQLYVNGKKAPVFEKQNLGYFTEGVPKMNSDQMESKFGLVENNDYYDMGENYLLFLTADELKTLKRSFPKAIFNLMNVDGMENQELSETGRKLENLRHYPKSVEVENTTENFQKFWVPKKGATIPLTHKNVLWYGRVITAYERHTLEEKNGKVYLDGKEAKSYTFEMDYYWMMGDNRYNSADSRIWGFVPEDHIVGRAAYVWLSTDARGTFPANIRWDRVFTSIK